MALARTAARLVLGAIDAGCDEEAEVLALPVRMIGEDRLRQAVRELIEEGVLVREGSRLKRAVPKG